MKKCNQFKLIQDTIDMQLNCKHAGKKKQFIHVAMILDRKTGQLQAISTSDSYICAERSVLEKMYHRNHSQQRRYKSSSMITWRINKSRNITSKGRPCKACSLAIKKCPYLFDIFYVHGKGWIHTKINCLRINNIITMGRQHGPSYRMSKFYKLV